MCTRQSLNSYNGDDLNRAPRSSHWLFHTWQPWVMLKYDRTAAGLTLWCCMCASVTGRKIQRIWAHSFCFHGDNNCLNSLIREQEAFLCHTVAHTHTLIQPCVFGGKQSSDILCLQSSVTGSSLLSLLVLKILNLPNLFLFMFCFLYNPNSAVMINLVCHSELLVLIDRRQQAAHATYKMPHMWTGCVSIRAYELSFKSNKFCVFQVQQHLFPTLLH